MKYDCCCVFVIPQPCCNSPGWLWRFQNRWLKNKKQLTERFSQIELPRRVSCPIWKQNASSANGSPKAGRMRGWFETQDFRHVSFCHPQEDIFIFTSWDLYKWEDIRFSFTSFTWHYTYTVDTETYFTQHRREDGKWKRTCDMEKKKKWSSLEKRRIKFPGWSSLPRVISACCRTKHQLAKRTV